MKTKEHEFANAVDLELYNLISKMKEQPEDWKLIISDLQNVRHKVREKMHPDDLKGTKRPFWGNGRDAEISRNRDGHFVACFIQNRLSVKVWG